MSSLGLCKQSFGTAEILLYTIDFLAGRGGRSKSDSSGLNWPKREKKTFGIAFKNLSKFTWVCGYTRNKSVHANAFHYSRTLAKGWVGEIRQKQTWNQEGGRWEVDTGWGGLCRHFNILRSRRFLAKVPAVAKERWKRQLHGGPQTRHRLFECKRLDEKCVSSSFLAAQVHTEKQTEDSGTLWRSHLPCGAFTPARWYHNRNKSRVGIYLLVCGNSLEHWFHVIDILLESFPATDEHAHQFPFTTI